MTNKYGEIFENYFDTGVKDTHGRTIGYLVILRDNGTDFRALVQNTRRIKNEWKEYGTRQRSKSFTSQSAATKWAYKTVNERISKIQNK